MIRLSFVAVLLAWAASSGAAAAQGLQLDAALEGGNLDGWSVSNGVYSVNTNNPPGAWQWLHFRATGALGETPVFRTNTAASDDVYRDYHRMVWRPEGQPEWRFFDAGDKPGNGWYSFWNTAPFPVDVVEIAYWQPYPPSRIAQLARRPALLGSPYLQQPRWIGASFEGRGLPAFSLTDPAVPAADKVHVVLVARQHGCESLGNWALEGMVELLLGDDPAAVSLRRKAVVHVYPMANPDAAANGWTREGRDRSGLSWVDFNRDWFHAAAPFGGAPSASLEVDALRADVLRRTGGSAAVMIDLHSHPKGSQGLGWYWWYQGDAADALFLAQRVRAHDEAAFPGDTVYSWPAPQAGSGSTTAMDWGGPRGIGVGAGTLDGLGLTLEPIAAPFGQNRGVARIRSAGAAVVRALDELL